MQLAINGRPLAAFTLRRTEDSIRSTFVPGDALADENVLTLTLPDAATPASLGGGTDDRELAVAVDWADLRPPDPLPEPLALNDASAVPFLGEGWSRVEDTFRWTEGPSAEIYFGAPAVEPLRLKVRLHPFVVAGRLTAQRVNVSLNGARATTLRITIPDAREYDLAFPASMVRRENVLRFELPDAASPASLGASDDPRVLGVAVESVARVPAAGPR